MNETLIEYDPLVSTKESKKLFTIEIKQIEKVDGTFWLRALLEDDRKFKRVVCESGIGPTSLSAMMLKVNAELAYRYGVVTGKTSQEVGVAR